MILLRLLGDIFRGAILEAIHAGGDTDTHAAIVGAMVGANSGTFGIPAYWAAYNPKYREAETWGRQLCWAASAERLKDLDTM